MKKAVVVLAAFFCLVAGCLTVQTHAVCAATEEVRIADGIFIGNVDVSGMTQREAQAAVDAYLEQVRSKTFVLSKGEDTIEVPASVMDITIDVSSEIEEALAIAHYGNLINRYKETCDLVRKNHVLPMKFHFDKQATALYIYEQGKPLEIEAIDNSVVRKNGSFTYVEGHRGRRVDVVSSVYALEDFLNEGWNGTDTGLTLVMEQIEPRGTREELSMITDVLGSFTTDFSTSAEGRQTNVRNGCSKIDGTLLYPGDLFSVYDTISPFNTANGYAMATAYSSGRVVESVGGGICQVSTTLYNAVIRAELDVTMRYNHSMIVSYVEPSDDAAIASGLKDLQFVNSSEYPVYIEGFCTDEGTITMRIYGVETRPSNRVVSFESEVLSEEGCPTEYLFSEEEPAGYYHVEQGEHKGIVSRLWKVVTVNGVEQSRDIFNKSVYKKSPKIVTIGTAGGSKLWMETVQEAIKTGDDAAVKAAVKNTDIAPVTDTLAEQAVEDGTAVTIENE